MINELDDRVGNIFMTLEEANQKLNLIDEEILDQRERLLKIDE